MDGYTRVAQLAKALAHPVRLQILDVLEAEGEACVCHLEHRLGQRQSYISQQLAKLRESGLVSDRRDGLNIFYAISDPGIPALVEHVRLQATFLAHAAGAELSFPEPGEVPPGRCNCPKCGQKISIAAPG